MNDAALLRSSLAAANRCAERERGKNYHLKARNTELEAENKRLRKALTRISGMCDVSGKCDCGRLTGVAAVRQCARAALLGEQR